MYSCSSILTVDGGSNFKSNHFKSVCKSYGVSLKILPAYTPELAGMIENLNRMVRYCLARVCGSDYSKWDEELLHILLGLRSRVLKRTGQSPFFLMFGVSPLLPSVDGTQDIRSVGSVALRNIEMDRLIGLRAVNERLLISSSHTLDFAEGSLVRVFSDVLRKKGIADKKKPRYYGPFIVFKSHPHGLYDLISENGSRKLAVHVSRLLPYQTRSGALASV